MRRIFGVILLFSFLVGALQPVLPLIEYHIFKESIIERFCVDRDLPQSDCEGTCYLSSQLAEHQDQDEEPLSLNIEFYPIGVLLAAGGEIPYAPGTDANPECQVRGPADTASGPDSPPPRTV